MSIEVQTKQVQPGSPITFSFSDNVTQYVTGVSQFSLTFGSDDHHVQDAELSISTNKPQPHQLQVTPSAVLKDSSGHVLDVGDSSITVVAIAWIGASATSLVMANRTDIDNGSTSGSITLPSPNMNILQTMLAGFNLEYSEDHHIRSISSQVGAQQDGTQGFIAGNAAMSDDSGHTASVAKVNGCLIGSSSTAPGFEIQSTGSLQASSTSLTFDSNYQKVQALLVSFKGQFSSDHHVRTFGAEVSAGGLSNNKSTVSGTMSMSDDSGHSQDNSNSSITGIVVAYDPK